MVCTLYGLWPDNPFARFDIFKSELHVRFLVQQSRSHNCNDLDLILSVLICSIFISTDLLLTKASKGNHANCCQKSCLTNRGRGCSINRTWKKHDTKEAQFASKSSFYFWRNTMLWNSTSQKRDRNPIKHTNYTGKGGEHYIIWWDKYLTLHSRYAPSEQFSQSNLVQRLL